MKKMLYSALLAMLVVPIILQNVNPADSFVTTDYPGDGFASGDSCGFVMGSASFGSAATGTGTIDFDTITPDDEQGCVDANGFFYSDGASGRESYAEFTHSNFPGTFVIDFDYGATTYVDQILEDTDGDGVMDSYLWQGRGRIISGPVPTPVTNRVVDFTWDCSDYACPSGFDPADYYVRTDSTTGQVSGYAWNDYFNTFISFNGLTQELPPRQIQTYVDVYANETDLGPDDVNYLTAPLADGAEFWRVRVQFWDTAQNRFLTPSEISYLAITPRETSDSNVYMNQVTNDGNAIETTYYNPASSIGCTTDSVYCTMTEDDASSSFNKFIYSGAPTSNVLGLNEDSDTEIEYYSDREGCKYIYTDQGTGTASPSNTADCPDGSGTVYDKDDVYADRQDGRNKWELEYITIQVQFSWTGETGMSTYGTESGSSVAFLEVDDDTWRYYFEDGTADLSYKPRYQIEKFVTFFDGAEHTSISEDKSKVMSLRTDALVSDTSSYFQGRGGAAKPMYYVNYQMDADSSNSKPVNADARLLIDTDAPPNSPTSGDVEETTRVDTLVASSPFYTNYVKDYAIAYGQAYSLCGMVGFTCGDPTNTLTNPTAEQWVCDTATETTMNENSCYYTEYLPHIDRHDEPESMLVIGAINSVIDADDVLEEISDDVGTDISILGNTETVNTRNKMYAQVVRYTLGQSAGSGSFDSTGAITGDLVELMNGRLIFAEGDVTIDGFDGSDKTLVVIGGDVFLNTNIENGRMGIISFKRNGEGGNVYILNTVTDLYANMFLDGSVFSYSGTAPTTTVYPTWGTDEVRLEALMDQLYLNGSIVSRNTVNGSVDSDGDGYYSLGDGTETTVYGEAREYDLNLLRQYRQCFPVVGGVLDTSSPEPCNEGEDLSAYGDLNGYLNSFILEYAPADQLPVFQSASSLFN